MINKIFIAFWVILHALLSSADFFKSAFLKNSFTNTIGVSNSLEPDQARQYVGPDLGPDCLQRLSADDTGRQRAHFQTQTSLISGWGFSIYWYTDRYTFTVILEVSFTGLDNFVWFDSSHPINNLSVIKGRVFLGWTSTKLGLMFLLKDTTQWRRWGSNPRQALYHWATALPTWQDNRRIYVKEGIIFIHQFNIGFGCSKEPCHWDGSFEYPQHMFWFRNKKIIFITNSS